MESSTETEAEKLQLLAYFVFESQVSNGTREEEKSLYLEAE